MTKTYRAAQAISFLYFKLFHRFRVLGLENTPEEGAFLLASNHISFFDPPALGCRLPRDLHYFARSSLFRGVFGKLIKALNSIPLDREGADITSFKRALKVLDKGSPLLVFPEGTRSPNGNLQPAKRGIGLLACKAKAPVLPARIFGSFEAFGKKRTCPKLGTRITIVYGPLLAIEDIDPGTRAGKRFDQIAENIMQAIADLQMENAS